LCACRDSAVAVAEEAREPPLFQDNHRKNLIRVVSLADEPRVAGPAVGYRLEVNLSVVRKRWGTVVEVCNEAVVVVVVAEDSDWVVGWRFVDNQLRQLSDNWLLEGIVEGFDFGSVAAVVPVADVASSVPDW